MHRFLTSLCVGFVLSCACLGVAPLRARAEVAPPDSTGFALVLGGGGARGLAHVGVIKALDELGMRPSLVVGTSMGAILGSLYAAGQSGAEIDQMLQRRHWLDLLFDRRSREWPVQGGWHGLPRPQLRMRFDEWPPSMPEGVSFGQSVEGLIGRHTADALFQAGGQFDALPIAFRAVATDVVRAEAVVYDHRALARVVRASGSLPVVFVPVEYEGRTLVDGGLLNNLPLDVVRELGIRRALVVDVSNVFVETEAPRGFFGVIERATHLGQTRQNEVDLLEGDVLLRMDLRDHSALGFWGTDELVQKGYAAAMEIEPALRALRDATAPTSTRAIPAPVAREVELSAVEVIGAQRAGARRVQGRLGAHEGARVQLSTLWTRADALAARAAFENVWLEVERETDGRARLTIHVLERRLPELEFAAQLYQDDGASLLSRLRLPTFLLPGGVNVLHWRLGEQQARVGVDLSEALPWGPELRVGGAWERERVEVYERGRELDAFVFGRRDLRTDVVVAGLPRSTALWVGARAATVDRYLESRVGAGSSGEWRAIHLGLETQRGSSFDAPTGRGLSVHAEWAAEVLGGDQNAWRIEGGGARAWSVGRYLGASLVGGFAVASEDLEPEWQARAGGPRGWVGMRRDEIVAPRLLWQRVGLDLYFQREVRLELAGALGWWGRSSLADNRPGVGAQLQLAVDTVLGPVRAGVAGRRGAESFVFLDIGFEF